MVSFTSNKIFLDSDTIAEQLRSTRQERGLKLGDVSKRLGINIKYLDALEKNQFDKLPVGVYGKNFLKEYSMFLGLDHAEMIKIFEKEIDVSKEEKQEKLFSAKVVKNIHIFAIPKILRNLIIILIIAVCFIFLGYRLQKIVSPPQLTIYNPQENLITAEKEIYVMGTTEPETQIEINAEQVLSDTKGYFSKMVDLKNGINIITIMAKKKYGKENTVIRQILVKEEGLQM